MRFQRRGIATAFMGCAIMLAHSTAHSSEIQSATIEVANIEVPSPADRPIVDDVIYFVLPDRFANGDPANDKGGISGGVSDHGFDPTHKGFYHGGDLRGLIEKLDYIQGLGVTAIWMTPIYQNNPVQRSATDRASSGYHGYWVTDFTRVDRHLGENDDLKALIDAAHARGMKVILDIITNHTADVIKLRECLDPSASPDTQIDYCPYRDKGSFPYATRGDVNGEAINKGFTGDAPGQQTEQNFKRLVRPDYAYTPYIPEGQENAKTPNWLNDPIYYHNRGDSLFRGESSLYGDFIGLDDLMTEHPRVQQGLIEIYRSWVESFDIDGYRIDTTRHVNTSFWRRFLPAIAAAAEAKGRPHFYMFGEVFDPSPAVLARFTHVDGLPTVLDFALQSRMRAVLSQGKSPMLLADLFKVDGIYKGGTKGAALLPTFVGNHDIGRFGYFLKSDRPTISDDEAFKRMRLAHALMIFARGVPVIYYGDEQGFTGDGGDQNAREDMFRSQVASYNDNDLMGTTRTTADDNFNTDHPLYQAIQTMTSLFHSHRPLRRGRQIVRFASDEEVGLFAISRQMDEPKDEYVFVINTSNQPMSQHIEVDVRSQNWQTLAGECEAQAAAPGSYMVTVPGLDYILCKSEF
ncbi:MAG: alpha-amylase family glycosyl hydrolase [Pseudomonadota bacterium]